MAIFRGVGGSGDSSDNSYLQEVTAQAQAAEASATSAANSLAAIQETEITSASFDTSDGVLTLTKTGGTTVTADLDGRFLTSYTETNDLSTAVTWADVPDANITQSSVTQHQAALSITESQISDLQSYLTSYTETNDLSTAVTWANVPDANITQSSVTQHQAALSITESQISDLQSYLTSFDITTQTDPKYLRADADDTTTGTITAPNVDISTSGTVTTNIATGAGGLGNTKTLNLGTGFASSLAGLTTVNIGAQSTSCQNTVNIGSGVSFAGKEDTINLKGNVTVDGTLSGLSHNYVIPLFQGYTSLSTSPTQIGDDFYLRTYNNKHYKRFVEVNAAMGYSGTTSTNDLNLRVIMVVPTSSGNAVDIGSVVSITTTATYNRDIVIAGDVTHWFSDYAGVGANSNGLAAFTTVPSAVYNPTTDQTTFNAGVYGATIPSVGDSIYVHPFDWESSGTEIYGHIKQFDVDAEASMIYQIYTKVYFGNIDRITTCRFKFYRTASSDSINIQRLQAYQTDESA